MERDSKVCFLLRQFCIVFICFFNISLYAGEFDELWIFESNFIKLGKKDAYEKFKKEFSKTVFNKSNPFSLYAYEDLEGLQYLYLIKVGEFDALEDFLMRVGVKIVVTDDLDDVADDAIVAQHAAEHAALGFAVVRR